MGKLFDLTDDIRQIAKDGLDDMIDQLGKICILYYPVNYNTTTVSVDPIGQKPASIWETGLQIREEYNKDTSGKAAERETDEVRMLVRWEPNDFWLKPGKGIVVPEGTIQTRCYQTDLPKIMRAEYIIVQQNISGVITLKFQRAGGPVDPSNIVPDRYAVINWTRVG